MAALPEELAAVLALMPDERREPLAGRDFWSGHLGGVEVVAVVSGIGKVAAATTATLLLQHFGADGVVFTGVAGGLGPGVAVGDVVVATQLLQHDMDASPLFPRHLVPGYASERWATDAAWSAALHGAAVRTLAEWPQRVGPAALARYGLQGAPRVHQGLIVSGDRFISTRVESEALRQRLPDALAVEMEGAAVAQVCADFGKPLAVVRTVSDRADEDAHLDFAAFVADVASHTSAYTVLQALPVLCAAGAGAAVR